MMSKSPSFRVHTTSCLPLTTTTRTLGFTWHTHVNTVHYVDSAVLAILRSRIGIDYTRNTPSLLFPSITHRRRILLLSCKLVPFDLQCQQRRPSFFLTTHSCDSPVCSVAQQHTYIAPRSALHSCMGWRIERPYLASTASRRTDFLGSSSAEASARRTTAFCGWTMSYRTRLGSMAR